MHLVLNNLIFMISEALASKQKVVLCELKEKQLLVASHHSPVFSFCKEKVLWLLRNVWAQLYDATFLNWDEISAFWQILQDASKIPPAKLQKNEIFQRLVGSTEQPE